MRYQQGKQHTSGYRHKIVFLPKHIVCGELDQFILISVFAPLPKPSPPPVVVINHQIFYPPSAYSLSPLPTWDMKRRLTQGCWERYSVWWKFREMKKNRISALLHCFAVLLSQTIMHGIRPLLSYLECRMFCEELLENPVKLWSLLVVVSSQILTTKCCKTPRVPTSLHWEGIRWQKMWVVVSILPVSATSTLFFLRKWVFSERKVNACRGFVSNSH